MKVETIKIEEELAHEVWAKGVRSPPRKVRVRMSKTEEGYVLVSRYDEEAEAKVSPEKETKKVSDKVEEPAKEAPKKEEPEKEEPAKEAPKKEEPAKEAPKKEEPAKEAPKKD
jgi:large subunit ribosomal protein L31e